MTLAPTRLESGTISVLIVDDEASVRDALAACLRDESLIEIVGSAAGAEEAITLARSSPPDVALVDFHMPGGGQHAVRGILECSPATRVVALTGSSGQRTVLKMLSAGATSYVVKSGNPEEIVETVLRCARGESILSAEVASGVVGELTAHLHRRELAESEAERLLERIRRVIDDQLFAPVFQPIFELATGSVHGLEALTRFSAEPAQGPEQWFADASDVGLRTELELATARAAVTAFADARPAGFLGINVSPESLPGCHEFLSAVGPHELVIELTEHAAIEDYEALAPVLAGLHAAGALLAVDDAGAGFASLRHALQLSPDFIKLDVSLTRGIDGDPRRAALAAGLIGFGNELGAALVAEGIETKAALDTLRELGVTYGQGYYLARPAAL